MNLVYRILSVFFVLGVMAFSVNTADAKVAKPKSLGKYGDWHAFEAMEDGNKVCYMVSPAKKSSGNYTKRGEVYMIVTHRPALKSYDVVSHHAGYTIKTGSDVNMLIKAKKEKKKATLFSEGEVAWCLDDKTDREVTEFLTKKGSEITVKGISSRGTNTTDIYSLNGSLKAYQAICKACDLKRD